MKLSDLIRILLGLSIFPVSILAMIYGWGLEAKNWGWIAFSYLYLYLISIVSF